MKIEISTGYVLMKEKMTRKTSREFTAKLYEGVTMGEDRLENLEMLNIEAAGEALVLALCEKVVNVDADGKETFSEPSSDWLDELDEIDYKKIERAAQKIKRDTQDAIKKL